VVNAGIFSEYGSLNRDFATTLAPSEQNIYRSKTNKQRKTPAEFYIETYKLSTDNVNESRRRHNLLVAQASRLH
jgi:hypothetical protein